MRCIEMTERFLNKYWFLWLTLTWDVLKSIWAYTKSILEFRLTLTWDVLKWRYTTLTTWSVVD